jgi:Transposase DDE domain group 1
MDSSVSPTHGEQENSMWNGHYDCTCYHPLFVFNQFGDLERCALRPGNVHSADGWENVLKPVVARYRGKVSRIYFRADAGFANPDIYEYLEAEGVKYAIRLPANRVCKNASATCSSVR